MADKLSVPRMSAIGPKQTCHDQLQCAADVVIWMMFAVAPALAVSALKSPPQDTQNPGYENPCEWFAWETTPLRVL